MPQAGSDLWYHTERPPRHSGSVQCGLGGNLAQFIAAHDPHISCALLAFAPHVYMADLPCTSVSHAKEAEAAARAAGLVNARAGNRHLSG